MIVTFKYGDSYDEVLVDGRRLDPTRSQAVWNHSPTGFSWGYGGSGPSQLALALLLEAGLDDETASRLHQRFKWDFVAHWPHDGEAEIDVIAWADRQLALAETNS